MKFVRRMLHRPELSPFLTHETIPGPRVDTDEAFLDFCRNNGSTGYHLAGTCMASSGSGSRMPR